MSSNEENLNPDEKRIAELVGTLKHVDAPKNFDGSVRARIAERREETLRTFWRPVLAGGLALVLLLFAGYLGLRSLNSGAIKPPAEVANTGTTAPVPVIQTQPSVAVPAPTTAPQTQGTVASGTQPKENKPAQPAQQGGSVDEALKDAPRKLFVRNFDPSPRKAGDTGGLGGQIPVTMIFEATGVHASWSDAGWRVDSVDAKNVAGRAGVKVGDVIEAINGQAVAEKTSFKGSFSGHSFRVRRDGSVIDIPFKP